MHGSTCNSRIFPEVDHSARSDRIVLVEYTTGSVVLLLGGLSLHLNHLIAWHMGICYRQFGTLPIGIFCQICTQDSLRHLL